MRSGLQHFCFVFLMVLGGLLSADTERTVVQRDGQELADAAQWQAPQ